MSQVHTPYHFVPLSKWIYMPDWAHLVSHDIPFKEGCSGVIDYTLTNATPLCVGGVQKQQSGQPTLVQWAKDPQGNPVIPGSSLKGMIRNVLEIASFGKFSAIDNDRFAYRDISNTKSRYAKMLNSHNVQAGWLKYDNERETWLFTESDFCKLAHEEIKKGIDIKVDNKLKAIEKYELIPLEREFSANISEPKGKQKNRWAESFNNGKIKGHCVFTNERILGQGKAKDYQFSYFFYNKKTIPISGVDKQVQDLFFNHRNIKCSLRGQNIDQVEYLQNFAHSEHGIPVFSLKKDSNINSFGLAKMPRVTYDKSAEELVSNYNKNHTSPTYFDMAELMFGTLRDNGLSLKSRITFSDATYSGNKNNLYTSKNVSLLSPKPTFLGGYINQDKEGEYNDYTTEGAVVSGWKRYGIKKEFLENNETDSDNDKVSTRLELLPEQSTFNGKIVFHNLKEEELAALFWSLKLGGSHFNCHSLGHGKSIGAGAVKLEINENNTHIQSNSQSTKYNISDLISTFEQHMNDKHYKKNGWTDSTQIKHFLAITDESISDYNELSYMELKDFKSVKTKNQTISLIDLNSEELSNEEETYIPVGNNAFGKGRLSLLIDKSLTWQQEELKLQKDYELHKEKLHLKSEANERLDDIINSTLPPFKRNQELLILMFEQQDDMSKTDKKNKAKVLRDILKELKEFELSIEEVKILLSIYEKLTIGPKEVDKSIKYLKSLIQ
jgi:CRISPR-associated protein (TIGR03986 family)